MKKKKPLLVTTDLNFPSDDFQALLLLLTAENLDVVGIIAETGNTWSEEVYENILLTLDIVGRPDIPVAVTPSVYSKKQKELALKSYKKGYRSFLGAYEKWDRPLLTKKRNLSGNHKALESDDLFLKVCRKYDGEITIVSLGPMTSIANIIERYPGLEKQLGSIIAMIGNLPSSELDRNRIDFNAWFDVRAAQKVFDTATSITIYPLSTCMEVKVKPAILRDLLNTNGISDYFVRDCLGMLAQHGDDMPLIDQLVAIHLINPNIVINSRRGKIQVVSSSLQKLGQTLFTETPMGNVSVIEKLDREVIWQVVSSQLGSLSLKSEYSRIKLADSTHEISDARFRIWISQRYTVRPHQIMTIGSLIGENQDMGVSYNVQFCTSEKDIQNLISELVMFILSQNTRIPHPKIFEEYSNQITSNETEKDLRLLQEKVIAKILFLIMKTDHLTISRGRNYEINGILGLSYIDSTKDIQRLYFQKKYGQEFNTNLANIEFCIVDYSNISMNILSQIHEQTTTYLLHSKFSSMPTDFLIELDTCKVQCEAYSKLGYELVEPMPSRQLSSIKRRLFKKTINFDR